MNEIGRIGYEAYANSTGGKTFDGRDMPKWEELPQRIRDAWHAAGGAYAQLPAPPTDALDEQIVGEFICAGLTITRESGAASGVVLTSVQGVRDLQQGQKYLVVFKELGDAAVPKTEPTLETKPA